MGFHSIKGRLLRIDLIQTWKAFHSNIDGGISDIFEYARNTGTRGLPISFLFPYVGKM